MHEDGRVPAEPGSREPDPAVPALTGFDPSRCQWCGDTGFDLKGLAEHVWRRCEVVERLAEENIEDVRWWHQKNWEAAQARKRDSDGSPKGRDATRLDGEAATARAEGIAEDSA